MLQNLERAADHPDMTEDLAELLSASNVTTQYQTITGVDIE
ncbi:hypothetical protein C447_12440 [Halococcus hamelinensis 100A6]|uniref:Uncharacterized protein n=1 Tax=Halococcus hamelinensis 100A6 TaxID=1132509 RepID=M0LW18_9EURY|nr:hypothetical protein C447_12440 [Halococcus hamelinensis 100A6]